MTTGLGDVTYLPLFEKDATTDTAGGKTSNWKWSIPTNIQARKAPVLYLSICSAYIDDSNVSAASPHNIRLKVPSENYLMNEKASPYLGYPIVAQLIRDAPAGHWYALPQNNPIIQISSNLQTLEFDIIDGKGQVIIINEIDSFNLIIKLEHPSHNEVRDNTVMSYAQSIVGNPPFNRL